MYRYSFNITWSEEDSEYVATCPAFPGLSALGETETEALAEGKVALDLFIQSYLADGTPLPPSEVVHDYSGQFRVRLSKSLHRQASQLAEMEGVSLNQFVANAVAVQVGALSYHDSLLRKLDGYLTRHAATLEYKTSNKVDINIIFRGDILHAGTVRWEQDAATRSANSQWQM